MINSVDQEYLIKKQIELRAWHKLVTSDEFKELRAYINSRVTEYINIRSEARKNYSLDNALKGQVADAVESELNNLIRHCDYMVNKFLNK